MKDVKISGVLWEALRALYLVDRSSRAPVELEVLEGIIRDEVQYFDKRKQTREKFLKGKFGKVSDSERYYPPLPVPSILVEATEGKKVRPEWVTPDLRRQFRSLFGFDIPANMDWLPETRELDPS